MAQSPITRTQSEITLQALAKDTSIATLIQVAGVSLAYLSQIFLAQWMGDREYGIYQYVTSWSWLLASIAGLGYPRTVLRFVSQYRVQQDWGRLRGLVRSSWLISLLVGLLLSVASMGVIWLLNQYHSFTYAIPLLVGIWLVPPQILLNLQLETARAMEDIILAYTPYKIIWPILLLCGGFVWLEKNGSLTSLPIIGMAIVLLLVLAGFQLGLLWKKLNDNIELATPIYALREWLQVSLVLLVQEAFNVILYQTDIVMIGSLLGPSETGIYSVAVKTAMWVGFILTTVNMVAAPTFAALYAQDDLQGLQKVISTITLWIFWPSLVLACCLIVFSNSILGVFGSEFIAVSGELKILVLGQLVSVFCGSVNMLMTVTGHQNKSVIVCGCAVLLNLILNAIAIPLIGTMGAAIATAFTTMAWNIGLCVLVIKYVRVNPIAFSFLFAQEVEREKE
ncbi:MAG: oligosaccharide flippase family protein [Nostoc sp.]|uniref:oligosaccharide flippase family protein n=1 Tax=Nostoc sp. TaxID=1180 RepID=UPI002FFC2DD7